LRVGEWYVLNHRAGQHGWRLGLLLSLDPWVRDYRTGLHRPHDPDEDGPVGQREVPVAEALPVVYLADGRPHTMTWAFDLHVGQDRGWGSRGGRVPIDSMHVEVRPDLVTITRL